jgi:PKD repeat protein
VGTQTGLNADDAGGCFTDSICDVQNGIDGWHGVANAAVHIAGPGQAGTVTVNLDASSSHDGGATWSTPFGCQGGVIGLGGPGDGSGPLDYRGDRTYYAATNGTVSMRKSSCVSGYSARTFKTAVMHELGHVIGLHHPNQVESIHSTTSPADWDAAVMHSSVPPSKPEAPQADDVQGIQYLYGTAAVGSPPVAGFSVSPVAPSAGSSVSFTDGSANAPTGWQWDFGDPASGTANGSRDQNPTHTFARAGSYPVTLYAGSLNGTGVATKTVVVAPGAASGPCVPSGTTLCLNDGRFSVTAHYRTSDGRSGDGAGVALTSDAGYFTFFNPANIEVVVKVLNACTLAPPRYWVFAAGLTNVEVTLTVTDTHTGGAPNVYVNPLNTPFAPIQDTNAFATCP